MRDRERLAIIYMRSVSALMIFLCHVVVYYPDKRISFSGQFFNVGVYIFLIISGFLYSMKNIDDKFTFGEWIWNRYTRITPPVIIWMVIIAFINFLQGIDISFVQIFSHSMNLEIFLPQINGMHHLWFMSVIMICYLTLFWVEKKVKVGIRLDKNIVLLFTGFGIISILGVIFNNINFISYLHCVMAFYAGYFMGRNGSQIKNISIVGGIALVLCAILFRVGGVLLLRWNVILLCDCRIHTYNSGTWNFYNVFESKLCILEI